MTVATFGKDAFGITPFGATPAATGTFGVASVVAVSTGVLRVTFSQLVQVDSALYEPGSYAITVRFGYADRLYVKRIVPDADHLTISVLLYLKNPNMIGGHYRLRVVGLRNVNGDLIEENT